MQACIWDNDIRDIIFLVNVSLVTKAWSRSTFSQRLKCWGIVGQDLCQGHVSKTIEPKRLRPDPYIDACKSSLLPPVLIANVHVRVFATLDANRRCIDEAALAIANACCMGTMVFAFAIVFVIALARSCARS